MQTPLILCEGEERVTEREATVVQFIFLRPRPVLAQAQGTHTSLPCAERFPSLVSSVKSAYQVVLGTLPGLREVQVHTALVMETEQLIVIERWDTLHSLEHAHARREWTQLYSSHWPLLVEEPYLLGPYLVPAQQENPTWVESEAVARIPGFKEAIADGLLWSGYFANDALSAEENVAILLVKGTTRGAIVSHLVAETEKGVRL